MSSTDPASAAAAAAAASAASSYAAQLGVVQALPSMRLATGPYCWRSDFDSGNMESVEYTGAHPLEHTFTAAHMSTPDTFDCFVSADPMSNYRVWFHCMVTGGRRGKQLRLRLRNLNNKKPLIGEGMRPLVRSTANPVWRRVGGVEFNTFNAPNGTGQARSFLPGDDGDGEEGEGEAEGEADEDGGTEESASALAASLAVSSIAATAVAPSAATPSNSGSIVVSGKSLTARKPQPSSSAASAPTSEPAAKRGKTKIKHDSMEITIMHTFDSDNEGDETAFAFCLPYSYVQLQGQLLAYEKRFTHAAASAAVLAAGANHSSTGRASLRDRDVYFHRELLVHSLEGRRIDLLTISSQAGRCADELEPDLPGLYPLPTLDSRRGADPARMWAPAPAAAVTAAPCPAEARACRFSASCGKLLVLLSARVHPGETPSSHMLAGALDFLLSAQDPRAAALRARCVFKVVPMLNPDGVAHGYYRTDTLGQNLNRFYTAPAPALQPSTFAVRSLVEQWHAARPGSLYAYIDLHAHAVKRGLFIFGNHVAAPAPPEQSLVLSALATAQTQAQAQAHVRNVSFAKLVALNSPFLALGNCSFAAGNMRARDSRDGLSKEGSGRVALFKATGCVHCYTVEVNYHCGRSVHPVAPLPEAPAFCATGAAGVGTMAGATAAVAEEKEEGSTVAASASSIASAARGSASGHSADMAASDLDLSWQREDHLLAQESLVGPPVQYGEAHFRSMGKALMVALLDMLPPQTQNAPAGTARADPGRHSSASAAASASASSNPYSRLAASEYGDLAGVERWAAQWIMAPPRKLARKLSKPTKNTTNSAASAASASAAAIGTPAPVSARSRSKNATPKTSPAASPRSSNSLRK